MNDNEPIKILLDALTGTLSDLSSKFERVVGSQDRLETHLSSIDKTMTAQAAALTSSRENIELIRKDLNAALETIKAVERQLQGDGHDPGVRGDLKELKEKATSDLTYLTQSIDGDGKTDPDGKRNVGIGGDIKFIRANMGWVSWVANSIRKPVVILGIIIGVGVAAYGVKQGWDSVKDSFITHQIALPTTPLNVKASTTVSNTVTLNWLPSTSKEANVVMYRVTRNGDLLGVAQSTSFVDDHIISNSVYCYSLQAVDSAGLISAPSPLQCVTSGK